MKSGEVYKAKDGDWSIVLGNHDDNTGEFVFEPNSWALDLPKGTRATCYIQYSEILNHYVKVNK